MSYDSGVGVAEREVVVDEQLECVEEAEVLTANDCDAESYPSVVQIHVSDLAYIDVCVRGLCAATLHGPRICSQHDAVTLRCRRCR